MQTTEVFTGIPIHTREYILGYSEGQKMFFLCPLGSPNCIINYMK